MTTYKSDAVTSPKHFDADGNAWNDDGKVNVPVTLATTDEVILGVIPAGIRLTALRIRNDDLDSNGAPTLAVKVGYRSIHPEQRVAPNDSYFGAGLTLLQAANPGAWLSFDPITFKEPVQIVMVPTTAAATKVAGAITSIFTGRVVGVV